MKKKMNGTMKIKNKEEMLFVENSHAQHENESGKYTKSNKKIPCSFHSQKISKNDFVCISLGH